MLFTTDFWYMAPTLSAITVFIAGLINGKFNITEGFWPQLVAWITGSVLSVGAWFLGAITVGINLVAVYVCFKVIDVINNKVTNKIRNEEYNSPLLRFVPIVMKMLKVLEPHLI